MHLYIHIPFCKRKCSYCDFVSGVYPDSVQTKYISALIAELAHIAAAVDLSRTKTIYIGGGTPSCLSSFNLERLLDALGRHLPIDQLDEYTIECNPESVDRDFVSVISRYGIDRVSMGIQSARREELLFLNRLHDFETAKKSRVASSRGRHPKAQRRSDLRSTGTKPRAACRESARLSHARAGAYLLLFADRRREYAADESA